MDNVDELTNCVTEILKICFSGSLIQLKRAVQKLLLIDSKQLNKYDNESNQILYERYKNSSKYIIDFPSSDDEAKPSDPASGKDGNSSNHVNGGSHSPNMADIHLTSLELSALEFIRDAKKHCVAHVAAAGGNLQILQTLLTSLPSLAYVEDENGENALFYSIRSLNSLTEAECDEEGLMNKLDCLLLLIGQCGVNCMNKNGASALHIACELGDLKIVKILLENNANVNICSASLGTPLSVCVARGYVDVFEFLLKSGADPNITTTNDTDDMARSCPPPIVFAASTGQLGVVKRLLESGAYVDLPDHQGWTALHCAAESGHLDLVELLIKHDANPNIKIDGKNPYYLAVYNGHLHIAEYLKKYTNPADIITFIHTKNEDSDDFGKNIEDSELKEEELSDAQIEESRRRANEFKDSGNKLVQAKHFEGAAAEYSKAISNCPTGPGFNELKSILYSNRSFAYLKLKKHKEALEDSQQSIKLNPGWSKAYLRLAHVYRETGEIVDYLHNLFQALVKDSENDELKKLFQTEFNKYRSS